MAAHARACGRGQRHGLTQAVCAPPRAAPHAGTAFLSHTMLGGRYVIRCAVGSTHTQGYHVEAAWRAVQRCATAVLAAHEGAR